MGKMQMRFYGEGKVDATDLLLFAVICIRKSGICV